MKVFDLTNGAGVGPERGHALSGLEFANATIVDRKALGVLRPGSADVPMRDAVAALMREAGLSFVVSTEPDDNGSTQLTLHVPEESWSGAFPRTARRSCWRT